MIFRQLEVGEMQNFAYIIGDEKTREAAIVDPGWDEDKIISECKKEGWRITKIFLTHAHFDHAQAAEPLARKTGATIYVHKSEEFNAEKIQYIEDEEELTIGGIKIKVFWTPGHTPGGVCFLIDGKKLLTGDTLFVGGVGRTDLPGGNSRVLKESLQKIASLGDSVEVWPGHDYGETKSGTIGREKRENSAMHL